MELIGRIIKQTFQRNTDGNYNVLNKPLYNFVLEDTQRNFCCDGVKGYFQFIKFLPTNNINLASSIGFSMFMIIGSPTNEEPNPQPIIQPFKYCPSCGEPFTTKVLKHTLIIQIRKIETTYQEVEIDDEGNKIEQ